MMDFEFDKNKSEANQQKHSIDFNEAKELWEDPDYVEIPVKTSDEQRFLIIGKISGKHWTGVITYRNKRIRRSKKEEIDIYES
ncbi:MAG: BrnT family toxin [Actinobacteria bacterium]|nr:BrnT family toxin [Actinomycetota bacterium]